MVPSYMVAQLTLFTARPVYSVHVGLTEAMGMALVPRKCTLKKKKKMLDRLVLSISKGHVAIMTQ